MKEEETKVNQETSETEAVKEDVVNTADEATAAETEVAEAEAEQGRDDSALQEAQDRYLRLQADFANFKKRSANERLQLTELVKSEVLLSILPVLDNFERALQTPQDELTEEMKSFVAGYDMIYKQLVEVLAKEGVTKMEALGKPFDPLYHQAVMRIAHEEYADDTVAEVLQNGYLIGEKTLRPAMVKVVFNG